MVLIEIICICILLYNYFFINICIHKVTTRIKYFNTRDKEKVISGRERKLGEKEREKKKKKDMTGEVSKWLMIIVVFEQMFHY